jgi:4-amino-4-deoxy-L-arabinose transferase-like glycosyltransferase
MLPVIAKSSPTNMTRRKQKAGSTLPVLMAAFFVTGAMLFVAVPLFQKYSAHIYSMGFVDGYDLIADNLAHGNGYRWTANMSETMLREPGYPLFLAAIFKLAGYHIEAVRFANWLLTIGIAFMIMRLTRTVTDDRNTALIASLLFLFHPGTLIAEARGGVEIFFIFVALALMLALHRAVEKGEPWRYFIAGLGFGFVLQVRSTPLAFPALLLLFLCLTAKGSRERLRMALNVAILGLGMTIVMTPWVIRNYQLVHEFVPFTSLKGVALQEGQYTCQNRSFLGDFYAAGKGAGLERGELASQLGLRFEGAQYFQVFYDAHDELTFSNILFQKAEAEYVKHPELLAACVGRNLFNFWFLGKTWRITELNMLVQVPLLALALSGLYLLWKRGLLNRMGIMLMFVLSIFAVHLPLVAEARYSIPVFALLTIPASVSVLAIWRKYSTHAQRGTI